METSTPKSTRRWGRGCTQSVPMLLSQSGDRMEQWPSARRRLDFEEEEPCTPCSSKTEVQSRSNCYDRTTSTMSTTSTRSPEWEESLWQDDTDQRSPRQPRITSSPCQPRQTTRRPPWKTTPCPSDPCSPRQCPSTTTRCPPWKPTTSPPARCPPRQPPSATSSVPSPPEQSTANSPATCPPYPDKATLEALTFPLVPDVTGNPCGQTAEECPDQNASSASASQRTKKHKDGCGSCSKAACEIVREIEELRRELRQHRDDILSSPGAKTPIQDVSGARPRRNCSPPSTPTSRNCSPAPSPTSRNCPPSQDVSGARPARNCSPPSSPPSPDCTQLQGCAELEDSTNNCDETWHTPPQSPKCKRTIVKDLVEHMDYSEGEIRKQIKKIMTDCKLERERRSP